MSERERVCVSECERVCVRASVCVFFIRVFLFDLI